MVPRDLADEFITMEDAVFETRYDSWKARASRAFAVPILSRPHTLVEVEKGEYSCRVLFQSLGKELQAKVERFLEGEIKRGTLRKTLSVWPIHGGIHAVVVGRGPTVESILDQPRYLAPGAILEGSILTAEGTDRFRMSFLNESIRHHLMGDLGEFAKVELISTDQVRVPGEELFPAPLRPMVPRLDPVDLRILTEVLRTGYYDEGTRKTTQDEMAKRVGVGKRMFNARLRRLSRIGLSTYLSPVPPSDELVASVLERMVKRRH